MENLYAYIIGVVILVCFLIYHELKRANKSRLFFRIVAVMVAAAALLFLIVPIKYEVERKTDARDLHFFTPGVSASDLGDEQYFTSDSTVLRQFAKGRVTFVPDLIYYLQAHPEISGLNIYGYGLSEPVAEQVGLQITFLPAAPPAGIISCSWPDILSSSETFRVQGIYNNTSDQAVKLLLQGLGTKLDSVTIGAKMQSSFSMQCQLRQTGKVVYQLIAQRGDEVGEREEVPFQVIERPKVKVLVLASFPDFEYKFLRNWLLENKYEAFFRTRVSKDKFSTDQVNLDSKESEVINEGTFKKYDLVIADDEELAQLGAIGAGLAREIESGLGLVIRLNEAKALSGFAKRFGISGTADSITSSFQPILSENGQKLKVLPVNQPLYIAASATQLRLVEDQKGKILASLAMNGNGKVAATAISSTFNWVLNGADADYAAYWSQLINATSRKSNDDFIWRYSPDFPSLNDQATITFQSSPDKPLAALNINGKPISVQQHQSLPFFWQGTFWAKHKGWNDFEVSPGARQRFYIYDAKDWASLKASNLIKVNKEIADKSALYKTKHADVVNVTEKSLSKWIFIGLFLISMGFIWFETKILQ